MTEGFLLINKEAGITSHDVISRLRKKTGIKRIGHAGTLDPFATGLLIVGIGRSATREMSKLVGLDKTYQAVFVLGASSDTDDVTGKIEKKDIKQISEDKIKKAMKNFIGEIEQIPPQYSAVKIKGKKMYQSARQGKHVKAKPRKVRIDKFELTKKPMLHDTYYMLHVTIECSSGTYIRAIARDLGEKLETGGYVKELRRTKIGPFSVENSSDSHLLSKEEVFAKIRA